MAVFHRQQPTCLDKHGNLTIVSTLKMAVGHHFHAGNCRGCGQTLWPCRENCKVFFLAYWWFAKIYACENFLLYGITLNKTIEVHTRSHFHIIPISATLQVHWSLSVSGVNPRIQACATRPFPSWDWDWQLLVWFYNSFFSLSVAKTWVSYIICAYHVCLHISEVCFMSVYTV